MKYIDEFRDRKLIEKVAAKICESAEPDRTYNFMEVCGTHTMSIFRFGLKSLLPENINLLSGPGCPVCVTPNEFIDKAIALAGMKNVIITTFGDMLRVPGSYSSLEKEKGKGASIKMVYSTEDALSIAAKHKDKEVVFLGIGFETTAPTVAQSILDAREKKVKNYSVLCANKTMPEALGVLAIDEPGKIDGFLLPGHVSAIIGTAPYEFLAKKYRKNCVVAGFEPLDIIQSVLMLIEQKKPAVEVQYTRIIDRRGNISAQKAIDKVFEKTTSVWRGIGKVKDSGFLIRKHYSDFDAEKKFNIKIKPVKENKACICGNVLKGIVTPFECKLFGRICNPENPVGACMVSSEGACAAYYKYRVQEKNE